MVKSDLSSMGAELELIPVSEIPQTQTSAGSCPIGTLAPQACRKCREGGGTQALPNTGLSSPSPPLTPLPRMPGRMMMEVTSAERKTEAMMAQVVSKGKKALVPG